MIEKVTMYKTSTGEVYVDYDDAIEHEIKTAQVTYLVGLLRTFSIRISPIDFHTIFDHWTDIDYRINEIRTEIRKINEGINPTTCTEDKKVTCPRTPNASVTNLMN